MKGRPAAMFRPLLPVALTGTPFVGRLLITPDRLEMRSPIRARPTPRMGYVFDSETLRLAMIVLWSLLNFSSPPSFPCWQLGFDQSWLRKGPEEDCRADASRSRVRHSPRASSRPDLLPLGLRRLG